MSRDLTTLYSAHLTAGNFCIKNNSYNNAFFPTVNTQCPVKYIYLIKILLIIE